jgi:hypothetical protein
MKLAQMHFAGQETYVVLLSHFTHAQPPDACPPHDSAELLVFVVPVTEMKRGRLFNDASIMDVQIEMLVSFLKTEQNLDALFSWVQHNFSLKDSANTLSYCSMNV